MSLPPPPSPPPSGPEGAPCAQCAGLLVADQRYCLQCGRRHGDARLDVLVHARGPAGRMRSAIHVAPPASALPAPRAPSLWPRGAPSPHVAASLCLAMLGGGVALGTAAGPGAAGTFTTGGRQIIAIVSPPPRPAEVLADAPSAAEDSAPPPTRAAPAPAAPTDPAGSSAETAPTAEAPPPPPAGGNDTPDVPETAAPSRLPPVKHVWVISLTGQRFEDTFGPGATEPYLATTLRARGTLLTHSYAIAHGTLPNSVALLTGQGPNPATQAGCAQLTALDPGTVDAADPQRQARGRGCLYPKAVTSLPDQLSATGRTTKAYVEGIADPDPAGPRTCRHAAAGQPDPYALLRAGDPYRSDRNPFVHLDAYVGDATRCAAEVVDTDALTTDLASADTTPTLSYIVPDACHDAGDVPCAPDAPAGLAAAAAWLAPVVDAITATAAYRESGLIVLTFDHAPQDGPRADSRACTCAPAMWPSTPNAGGPSTPGRGGGRVGTLLLSPFVAEGRTLGVQLDPISLLKSLEDLFGLEHLGAAAADTRHALGPGAYPRYVPPRG